MKRPVFFVSCLLLLSASGCAVSMERSQVESRFAAVFGCNAERVVNEMGGYRVEGCGVVAHYRCIDTDDTDEESFIGILIEDATDEGQCVMEHSEKNPPTPKAEPGVLAERDASGVRTLKARLSIEGGHLTAFGKPATHPGHAMLMLYSVAPLASGRCSNELFRDGAPLALERTERVSDHELRVLVRLEVLRDVQHALRFAGNMCGLEFDLDAKGREQLGLFYIRVSEELAHLNATSGGLSAAK